MKRSLLTLLFSVLLPSTSFVHADDWAQWRGPTGDNHAPANATAPVKWHKDTNVKWVVSVPGRGHSSPTVLGDRIYLTTADKEKETQSLLIYDRHSGKLIKETIIHSGGMTTKAHKNNTQASSTVASDGKRVFVLFPNKKAAWVTALDLDGKKIWQERALGFAPQQFKFGFGSSPVVIDNLVVVASEYDGEESGFIALDTATGKQKWKTARPKSLSYSTPAVASGNGKRFLITSGNNHIAAYNPRNGKELWAVEATTFATCGTMVWDEELGLAFASGGFPGTFTLAIQTDGEHEIVWHNNRLKCYEQSLLLVDGYIYAVTDRGLVHCLRATDGKTLWKERLGGSFSSSPLLIDGKIYVTNEAGKTFVFVASHEEFESLGENQLGTECFATPTPIGNRLYHRFAEGSGPDRQEYLAAIGE